MNPRMTYSFDMFGTAVRSVREVLVLREFRSLLLDLKLIGAFGKTVALPCSWQRIELSVWHHFHLDLEGLTHYRENNWIEWDQTNRHQIAVRIVASIIKILSVKCPCPECDECFIDIAGIMLSGLHINHRGLKNIEFGEAVKKGIDAFLKECSKSNPEIICAMHHGFANVGQNHSGSDYAKLEWVIPSLGVRSNN